MAKLKFKSKPAIELSAMLNAGWIAVIDKIPECDYGKYLVSDGVNVAEASWLRRTVNETNWFYFTSIRNITHWMEMPKPPSCI